MSTLSLKDVYPVGSVYITMNADVPAAFKVGMTWVKLTEGRCLWNATNDQLGDENLEGILPDHTHSHQISNSGWGSTPEQLGWAIAQWVDQGNSTDGPTLTDVSGVSVGKTLRPPSIGVAMFKRTA